jgi:hypothetical protein
MQVRAFSAMKIKENLGKGDKKFLIQVNQSNRDYLTNCANITLTQCVSFSALLFSFYGIYLTIAGVSKVSLFVGAVIIISLSPYWTHTFQSYQFMIKYAKKINEQYQKYYLELFEKK